MDVNEQGTDDAKVKNTTSSSTVQFLRLSRGMRTHLRVYAPIHLTPPRALLRWPFGAQGAKQSSSSGMEEKWRSPQHFAPQPWWNASTVAVVTGSNKGIGLEIARQLAVQGVTVVATARDVQLGQAAAERLSADVKRDVQFHQVCMFLIKVSSQVPVYSLVVRSWT
jgi:3-oxoacyl-ACP reductase-like protein